MKVSKINAKKIYDYFQIYRMYLQDNLLDDDSSSLSVEDLVEFIEEYMAPEDLEKYKETLYGHN